MATYGIDLAKASNIRPSELLVSFADWLGRQEHGSLGWFDGLYLQEVPAQWNPAYPMSSVAYSFIPAGDGGMYALMQTDGQDVPAVVLLSSEGKVFSIAPSLEAFLYLLAEKGIDEIDQSEIDEGLDGRPALKAWLAANNIVVPEVPQFDAAAWLADREA